jgi:hypothetical protein
MAQVRYRYVEEILAKKRRGNAEYLIKGEARAARL